MDSNPIYKAITRHWPKIATGCVVVVGILEFVIDGIAADSTLEIYLLAWGSLTAGLWFLFDIAEKSLSAELKQQVQRMPTLSVASYLESLPSSFTSLFDSIFGSNHYTLRCFGASCVVSMVGTIVVGLLAVAAGVFDPLFESNSGLYEASRTEQVITMLPLGMLLSLIYNLIPDYLSLLESRWLLGKVRSTGQFGLILAIDVVCTFFIYVLWLFLLFVVPPLIVEISQPPEFSLQTIWEMATFDYNLFYTNSEWTINGVLGIFFYTTFFTSLWLWVYVFTTFISRALLKLNSGVGVLLKAADFEVQPFRSLGFVSVLLVSGIFLLGLPFVLM